MQSAGYFIANDTFEYVICDIYLLQNNGTPLAVTQIVTEILKDGS